MKYGDRRDLGLLAVCPGREQKTFLGFKTFFFLRLKVGFLSVNYPSLARYWASFLVGFYLDWSIEYGRIGHVRVKIQNVLKSKI